MMTPLDFLLLICCHCSQIFRQWAFNINCLSPPAYRCATHFQFESLKRLEFVVVAHRANLDQNTKVTHHEKNHLICTTGTPRDGFQSKLKSSGCGLFLLHKKWSFEQFWLISYVVKLGISKGHSQLISILVENYPLGSQ